MLINKETNRSVFVRIVYDCVQKAWVAVTYSLRYRCTSVDVPLIIRWYFDIYSMDLRFANEEQSKGERRMNEGWTEDEREPNEDRTKTDRRPNENLSKTEREPIEDQSKTEREVL